MLQVLPSESYSVNRWSGGETTEIFIYPKTSSYTQRNFDVRISTATVAVDYSTFTDLPAYQRYLSVLEGATTLTHQMSAGSQRVTLTPFKQDYFSGAVETTSEGQCRDFNMMLSERMEGTMLPIMNGRLVFNRQEQALLFAVKPLTVTAANEEKIITLRPFNALLITDFSGAIWIENESREMGGMLCRFNEQ